MNKVYLKASRLLLLSLTLALLTLNVFVAPTASAVSSYPSSMAATGDSITRGFNSVSFLKESLDYSWSTGTNTSISNTASQYLQILSKNTSISGKNYNYAVTGAKMGGLATQMDNFINQKVEYVTILVGANDACTSSESAMTPVNDFKDQFAAAMSKLSTYLPDARIFVASIPNIKNLWAQLKGNGSARFAWWLYGICKSMLSNPLSTSQTDVERRNKVEQRVKDFNSALKEVCDTYVHCRTDYNSTLKQFEVFSTTFTPGDVSTIDYFHPSRAGQAKLASVTYAATFNFADTVAPVTTAKTAITSGGQTVTLTATDSAGVAGIEYKLNGSTAWTKYAAPVFVPAGKSLVYRAVDKNGNNEVAKNFMA